MPRQKIVLVKNSRITCSRAYLFGQIKILRLNQPFQSLTVRKENHVAKHINWVLRYDSNHDCDV